ncbi:hypothetical protein F3Y22_tig00112980pilonHSYRG00016 [Hibiscus syriacus]|uniref:Apple domain-containing protein n=1 Tax=Hibiscus syriacus TaxID=106335 RepID=A0A6A2Y1G6_HIBSY|nr:hypothetical protein F3Y22_tig00112980pilonHSYRG00016 [Hibiscus syriacus]
MNWIDNNGLFLVSNSSEFGFGFATTTSDVTRFLLVIVDITTTKNQEFKQGMRLISKRSPGNLTYILEIKRDDMVLSAESSSTGKFPVIRAEHPKLETPSLLELSSSAYKTGVASSCGNGKDSVGLVDAGTGLDYFALGHVSPWSKTDLNGCKASCLSNCDCVAMFYDNNSRICFIFDDIGSFRSSKNESDLVGFVKISEIGRGDRRGKRGFPYIEILQEKENIAGISWEDSVLCTEELFQMELDFFEFVKPAAVIGDSTFLVSAPSMFNGDDYLSAVRLSAHFACRTQELVALSGAHTIGTGMSTMIGLPSEHAVVEDDECLRLVLDKRLTEESLFDRRRWIVKKSELVL